MSCVWINCEDFQVTAWCSLQIFVGFYVFEFIFRISRWRPDVPFNSVKCFVFELIVRISRWRSDAPFNCIKWLVFSSISSHCFNQFSIVIHGPAYRWKASCFNLMDCLSHHHFHQSYFFNQFSDVIHGPANLWIISCFNWMDCLSHHHFHQWYRFNQFSNVIHGRPRPTAE